MNMDRSKRNELCHCGSGKIHKKCCGFSNVVQINPQLYNDELHDLHDHLLAYALTNYEDKFIKQSELQFQSSLSNLEGNVESYLTAFTAWMILHTPMVRNNETIIEDFYKHQKRNIKRTRTKNTFLDWKNTVPSVYEAQSIDDHTQMITISDITTHESFQIPLDDAHEFFENDLLVGILVPFVGYHSFFLNTLAISGDHKNAITSLLNDFSQTEGQLQNNFPDFLSQVLLIDQPIIEWGEPLYEQVAQLFFDHMVNKSIDEETISLGIIIWHRYTDIAQPTIKKAEAYAAALEYFVQIFVMDHQHVTQKEIAMEYETTAGTVSINSRKIRETLEGSIDHDGDDHLENEQAFDLWEEYSSQSTYMNAQELLSEAAQTSGKNRARLIEEALTIYPNNPSAYLLLAENAPTDEMHAKLLRQAILVGEEDLGKEFFMENKGHFWMISETRPYMRAKETYANFLYEIGDNDEAIKHFSDILQLNPTDNQGVRYTLLTLYIEVDQLNKADKLIKMFEDEATAPFLFNKIIVDYMLNGLTNQTKRFIKEANKQNPFVKDYLLGNNDIPDQEFDYVSFGDETEAIVYAQEHIHIWSEVPALLQELSH